MVSVCGSGLKPQLNAHWLRVQINTSAVKCMCGGLITPAGIITPPT